MTSPPPALQRRHPVVLLLFWLAVVFAAAVLGALGSRAAPTFYAELALPTWAPPASWFGPVWTALYAAMGIAAWLVARAPGNHRKALTLFGAQLAVNVLWSWLFFHWRTGEGAIADILLLDVLVIGTIVAFWRVRRLAALLLLPYLAWILFATALCIACWRMNPGLL
jgi:benzodiazapine receptor